MVVLKPLKFSKGSLFELFAARQLRSLREGSPEIEVDIEDRSGCDQNMDDTYRGNMIQERQQRVEVIHNRIDDTWQDHCNKPILLLRRVLSMQNFNTMPLYFENINFFHFSACCRLEGRVICDDRTDGEIRRVL